MDPEADQTPSGARPRTLVLVSVALLALVATAVIYLGQGKVVRGPSRPSSPPAAARPTPQPSSLPCASPSLAISGAINDCGTAFGTAFCPADPSSSVPRVERLSGRKFDFLLYIALGRAYRGPAAYPLTPWRGATLDADDGVVKVALREAVSGMLWESAAGSLTIDPGGRSGSMFAGLVEPGSRGTEIAVTISGGWQCP